LSSTFRLEFNEENWLFCRHFAHKKPAHSQPSASQPTPASASPRTHTHAHAQNFLPPIPVITLPECGGWDTLVEANWKNAFCYIPPQIFAIFEPKYTALLRLRKTL
jgi:hypothetical protein